MKFKLVPIMFLQLKLGSDCQVKIGGFLQSNYTHFTAKCLSLPDKLMDHCVFLEHEDSINMSGNFSEGHSELKNSNILAGI